VTSQLFARPQAVVGLGVNRISTEALASPNFQPSHNNRLDFQRLESVHAQSRPRPPLNLGPPQPQLA
jgi:hypothetical protein